MGIASDQQDMGSGTATRLTADPLVLPSGRVGADEDLGLRGDRCCALQPTGEHRELEDTVAETKHPPQSNPLSAAFNTACVRSRTPIFARMLDT